MKRFHKNLNVFALFLLLFSFCGPLFPQTGYVPDESMGMKAFQEQALTAKEEIWVVDFWASWCGPCIYSIPEMKELHEKLQGKPVRFVSISWDKDRKAWRAMMQKMQMPWQQIIVPDIHNAPFLTKHFPHNFIPALFMITRKGKVKKAKNVQKLDMMLSKELNG